MCNTGVYCWKNKVNGKVYVGSASQCFSRRKSAHLRNLKNGVHWNEHLQRAWNKYPGAFVFQVLERCSPDLAVVREQYWIDKLKSANPEYGYNLSPTAGSSLGTKMTDRQKERYRTAAKERAKLPQVKAGIEAFKQRLVTDNPNRSSEPEVRAKISASLRGKRQSPETIAKRVASLKGKKRTAEHRARMSAVALANRENRRKAALKRWHGITA
jgi:group I intron endonuclease